jgi:hypothetical protein
MAIIQLDVNAWHGNLGGPVVSLTIGILHGSIPGRVFSNDNYDLDEISYTFPIKYHKWVFYWIDFQNTKESYLIIAMIVSD